MKQKSLGAHGGGIFPFLKGRAKGEIVDMSKSWPKERRVGSVFQAEGTAK